MVTRPAQRRGSGHWAVPLAAVTAVAITAGVSAAITVSRIDHGTAAVGARSIVAAARK